ncbi:hypothetical protein CK203_001385 [Vitis vinifera]|uniref:Uncharacterized protein n=1 Tax=Vitis vinifera TaxID=29760 RepID=A0A438KKZ0_VITVI|nr:hypothetical protein CK203_001385 [Vitis vinifera]
MDKEEEDGGSVHLQVSELTKLSGACSSGDTMFTPQSRIEKGDSNNSNSVSEIRPAVSAPEKQLTIFALRLAVLEKVATSLGTLGFIWATVVLLGGFAITLAKTDFWFITIILLIEGTRIFSRSHELEWQHQATWPIAVRKQSQHSREVSGRNNPEASPGNWGTRKMPSRTWKTSDVPLLPYAPWVFLSRNISKLLYWLQLLSATACVVLSLLKLIKHDYGRWQKGILTRGTEICSDYFLCLGLGRGFDVSNGESLLGVEAQLL